MGTAVESVKAAMEQALLHERLAPYRNLADDYMLDVLSNGHELALNLRPKEYDPDGMHFWKRLEIAGLDADIVDTVKSLDRQVIGLLQYANRKVGRTPRCYARSHHKSV